MATSPLPPSGFPLFDERSIGMTTLRRTPGEGPRPDPQERAGGGRSNVEERRSGRRPGRADRGTEARQRRPSSATTRSTADPRDRPPLPRLHRRAPAERRPPAPRLGDDAPGQRSLERIGDYAVTIAREALQLPHGPSRPDPRDMEDMAEQAADDAGAGDGGLQRLRMPSWRAGTMAMAAQVEFSPRHGLRRPDRGKRDGSRGDPLPLRSC